MSKLRRLITISVMVMTIVVMSGAVVAPVKAAASAGDLIKMDGLSSVYYLGEDGKRYVFPNEATYFSWYSDWSGVVTVSSTELASYPLGSNVVMRPGTKLVKITTDPTVYAVEPDGTLRSIVSEANAIALYGENWASMVVDVPDSFFTNYTVGSPLTVGVYPVGTLLQMSGSSDIYYFDGTNYRMFADEASFLANRFSFGHVITTSMSLSAGGTTISAAEETLADTSQGGGGGTGSAAGGSGLSVALSANTAAAGTLIYGQAGANMASFNLTASNDGDVKVTKVVVKRTGVSSDATLASSYLYEGNTRLTDNASVSSGYITWVNTAGILTIPAGTTKTITVQSDLGSVGSGTVAVGIESASMIETASGATVSGSFPVTGNTMSLTGEASTLATVAFATPTPSTDGAPNSGETDFSVWKSTTSVNTRDVELSSIRFRQIGSINSTDLKNFKFYVDGVQQGSTIQLNDNYLDFVFATPLTLRTGSRILEVRADLENGATRTYSFSVQYAVDVKVVDSEYGANIKATGVPASTASQTIGSGSLTVTKLNTSPSGNITKDASGVTLASFEFKATGENIKVEYLRASITASTTTPTAYTLRNGAIYANGVQVGSTASIAEDSDSTQAYTDFNLGSSLIVVPGSPVTVEIKADIYDNDGTNTIQSGDTILANFAAYTNGYQKMTSLSYANTPAVSGNTLTVATGSITGAKLSSYGDRTVVVPQTSSYKIGSYVVQGNSTEEVNLNTITIAYTGTAPVAQLSDMYIVYGGTTSTSKAAPSSSNSWSINKTLGINESMTIDVYSKLGSSITTGSTTVTTLVVAGTTAQSAAAATFSAVTGQTMTAGAGDLTIALAADTPVAQIVKGNQTVDVAKYKFTAENDQYTVTEVKVSLPASTTAVDSVILKDGSTVLGTAYLDSSDDATFSGLNVIVPANQTKTLTVALDLATVGTGAGATGSNVQVTMVSYKELPLATGTEATTADTTAANTIYVYKAIPTISNASLPSTVLTAGTQTLAKVTVAADGEIEWKQMMFTFTKSSGVSVATASLAMYDSSGQQVAGTFTAEDLASTTDTTGTIKFVPTSSQAVSSSETYSVKGTVGGTISDNYYITTSLTQPSSYAASAAFLDSATTTSTFIWSDLGLNSHDTTTADWAGDAYIKNLPTDAQTLQN